MTIHSLMTICKYCLVDRYKVLFSNKSPTKEEVLGAIFEHIFEKEVFSDTSDNTVLQAFYDMEAREYDNLSHNKKKKLRQAVRHSVSTHKKTHRGERCRVTSEPAVTLYPSINSYSRSQYINCTPEEQQALPF
jgi:hypothetical protein